MATTSITVSQPALAKAMALLARVVERRTTIPILANARISIAGEGVTLTATDLDIEVKTTLDCEASGTGGITVNGALLNDLARKIAENVEITLSWDAEGKAVTMKAGRSRFSLQALPASDFPDISIGEMTHRFVLGAKSLADMLAAISFAISTEETRFYLNGVYLHTLTEGDGPVLRGVATDGHRLARHDILSPEGAETAPGVIIPRKTVAQVAHLAAEATNKKGEGEVSIALSPVKIQFSTQGVTLTSKLIDGTFPDYQRIIPQRNAYTATLNREALIKALDRVGTIASERGRAVKLSFEESVTRLSVSNPDAGTAEDEIATRFEGKPFETGYNTRYLLDILGALAGDEITFKLADAGSAALLSGPDPATIAVIMPMRVRR